MKNRIFLMLVIFTSTEMTAVKFHNLNDNPGLLPLKLGTSQNIIDKWSFIQIFDITDIITEFTSLQHKFFQLKSNIENSTIFKREFYNSYHLISNFENKIITQINQLSPSLNKRSKRGIINGLGSIIKSITGNLDHNDAEKYDKIINELTGNQIKMKTIVKEQVSLLENSIQLYKNNTKKLAHNQITLEARIKQMERIMKPEFLKKPNAYDIFYTQVIISQILTAFQVIYDLLEKIEVAISFSKINTFHNAIVNPNELLSEIKTISKHLIKLKLPFEPSLENILFFEKILEIKGYIKEKKIIFIIEIPLVECEKYDYYRLYPLPIPIKNNLFKIIIPKSKYLILNELKYVYSEERCINIDIDQYICYMFNPIKIQETNPCEIQMLSYSKNITNCLSIQIEVKEVTVRKIEEHQKWIIVTPNETLAIQRCGSTKENVLLNGTYILEVESQCEIQINDLIIRNYQNSISNYKNIQLPQINVERDGPAQKPLNTLKPFNLDQIDLGEIHHIQSILATEKQRINEVSEIPVHLYKFSIWTIILYILMTLLSCYFIYFKCIKTKQLNSNVIMENSHQDIIV